MSRTWGSMTGRLSSRLPNMQNIPRSQVAHGFEEGDRVVMRSGDDEVMFPGRKGTVTYAKKLRRVSVRWDDGTSAQIRTRFLRKLHELEELAEEAEKILGEK